MPDGFGDNIDIGLLNAVHDASHWRHKSATVADPLVRAHVLHLRNQHGMTIKEIADQTGFGYTRVRLIING